MMRRSDTVGNSILRIVTEPAPAIPPAVPTSKSYLLLGPPDLLHDVLVEFDDIGWAVSADRWQAVITAPPEDADSPEPGWPAQVTLQGTSRDGHEAACREHLAPIE